MSARSLNGLNGTNTNVVITNRILATLPLEMTQTLFTDPIVLSMKGLNGFGGANKIIKVNSSNNGLIYADDNTENITVSSPLIRTADNISLIGLSTTFAGAGKVIKINSTNDGLEYADDINENITVSSPLIRTADNISLIGLSTTFAGAGKVVKINSTNDGLEYADDIGSIWTASSNILTPVDTTNNIIKLIQSGTDSAIIGDIANPSNTTKPFIKYGSFETLYGKDTRHISASIQNFSGSAFQSVDLTCNASSDILEISNAINVNGRVECDSIKLTDSTQQILNGSNYYTLPSSTGTLALTTDIDPTLWSASGNVLTPSPSTNNKILLTGTDSEIIGDNTNSQNSLYPYVKYGSFRFNYAGTCSVENILRVSNFSVPGQVRSVEITCLSTRDALSFTNRIEVYGDIVSTETFISTRGSSQLSDGSNFFTFPSTGGTLALLTQIPIVPTAIWTTTGSTGITPNDSNNNIIVLAGSSSAIIGSITNSYNSAYPYIGHGSFQTIYTDNIEIEGSLIQTNQSSSTYKLPYQISGNTDGSGYLDYTITSTGLSRQGGNATTNRIYKKAFRFIASTSQSLYVGTTINVDWDGTYKQIKFDIKTGYTGWWDASVFHIRGGQTLTPTISYSADDIASSGSGNFLTAPSGAVNTAYGLFSYGTRVQAHLIPEGYSSSLNKPTFYFDVVSGNSENCTILMTIISNSGSS